jgi:FKBP-type peptidyl-prolyl cis-trans isomerase FkpA
VSVHKYFFILGIFFLCSCTKKKDFSSLSDNDKSLYLLGSLFAQRVSYLDLSTREQDIVFQGFSSYHTDKDPELIIKQNRHLLDQLINKRMRLAAMKKKEESKLIFSKFKKDGGQITKSGLGFKIKKPGDKQRPRIKDLVNIHYHGSLPDGRVFDSSIDRKRKVTLPMGSVIRGWQEALQMIGEGGEIEVVVPSDLAYGDRGSPPKILGGQTLAFKIFLYKIIDPDAKK